MEAYCVKCKLKREIANPEATFTSTGNPATKGICPVCGTGLYRMGKTPAHEGLEPPPVSERKRSKTKVKKRKGRLVIVESPAKARTVGRMLGKGYSVKASVGHVRDLLRSQISVDVENKFEPKYRVPNDKRDVVKGLKADASKAEEVFLATDPDREGEAIAWHLIEAAEIDPEVIRRVVFHEITKPAVEHAFGSPRAIDMDLVDAQQARRILDRLVGYNLSPLLWRKVRGRLSAGRVQSVALRLIVDREREIEAFVPREYWTIDGEFVQPDKPPKFNARLVRVDGAEPELGGEDEVNHLLDDLKAAVYIVSLVKPGTRRRKPAAPFTTSTLQQAASRRFGYTARKTMAIAQQLYEGVEFGEGEGVGLITYMRTDSTQISAQAIQEVRSHIQETYGDEFLPTNPVVYKKKSRGAQEAHEAVRPTSVGRTPEKMKPHLSSDQHKLYNLIWRRFVASQMAPAVYDTLTIEPLGKSEKHEYRFRVTASSLRFSGFLEVYKDSEKDPANNAQSDGAGKGLVSKLAQLPGLVEGDVLNLLALIPEQHFTQAPPRYSDASLVKTMEEHGIGRPSTYAPTISTLRQRGYVFREKRRLNPTEIGMTVNDLIVEYFPEIVDFGFTARLEERLDDISTGKQDWVEVVRDFYEPFSVQLEIAAEAMPEIKAEPETIDRLCPECGNQLVIRHGRYGKFIGCSDFPTCRFTEPWLEKIGVLCPLDGGEIIKRRTKKGRTFYGCANYPECEFTSWKRPIAHACPACGGLLVVENRTSAVCTQCGEKFDLESLGHTVEDLA